MGATLLSCRMASQQVFRHRRQFLEQIGQRLIVDLQKAGRATFTPGETTKSITSEGKDNGEEETHVGG
jgi:hypothetical protein